MTKIVELNAADDARLLPARLHALADAITAGVYEATDVYVVLRNAGADPQIFALGHRHENAEIYYELHRAARQMMGG